MVGTDLKFRSQQQGTKNVDVSRGQLPLHADHELRQHNDTPSRQFRDRCLFTPCGTAATASVNVYPGNNESATFWRISDPATAVAFQPGRTTSIQKADTIRTRTDVRA